MKCDGKQPVVFYGPDAAKHFLTTFTLEEIHDKLENPKEMMMIDDDKASIITISKRLHNAIFATNSEQQRETNNMTECEITVTSLESI